MNHTKEPWTDYAGGIFIVNETGETQIICTLEGRQNNIENAARIVACINACAGIDNPQEFIQKAKDRLMEDQRFERENRKAMTLLEYYVAHAPKVPQKWFIPEMPKKPMHLGSGKRAQQELTNARYKWDQEFERQRQLQWPLAWAREMVRQLESVTYDFNESKGAKEAQLNEDIGLLNVQFCVPKSFGAYSTDYLRGIRQYILDNCKDLNDQSEIDRLAEEYRKHTGEKKDAATAESEIVHPKVKSFGESLEDLLLAKSQRDQAWKDDKEIRKIIGADENESTVDEVERFVMKSKDTIKNLRKDLLESLGSKEEKRDVPHTDIKTFSDLVDKVLGEGIKIRVWKKQDGELEVWSNLMGKFFDVKIEEGPSGTDGFLYRID